MKPDPRPDSVNLPGSETLREALRKHRFAFGNGLTAEGERLHLTEMRDSLLQTLRFRELILCARELTPQR